MGRMAKDTTTLARELGDRKEEDKELEKKKIEQKEKEEHKLEGRRESGGLSRRPSRVKVIVLSFKHGGWITTFVNISEINGQSYLFSTLSPNLQSRNTSVHSLSSAYVNGGLQTSLLPASNGNGLAWPLYHPCLPSLLKLLWRKVQKVFMIDFLWEEFLSQSPSQLLHQLSELSS
ncbi:hypothetical protein CK203_117132 [Vitis vinifera]|uniref:Uncharacterized protein n=1 Tax=Vitis vinifera TaxID=29760 RepID=A0A438C466_VITVI|nr:hypothetical protein CK203_117132 [Vitis vinifera]